MDQEQPQSESAELLMTTTSQFTYQHNVQSGLNYTIVLI